MFLKRENKESIFRKESLEQLSSPERLDQLMQVINPMDWLALTVLISLVGIGLVWSIVGRIPVTVEGRGIFTQPRRLVEFQSSIAGQLQSLNVRNGQCFKKGQVLGTVDPIDLRQQLQLARGKLAQLQAQAEDSISLSSQRIQLEKSAIAASRVGFEQRLKDTRALTPVLQSKGVDAISEQRRSLEQRLKDAQILVPVMQKRFEQRKALATEGAIPRDSILQVEQEYVQARQSVADIEAQLKQLDVQSTETQRQYLDNLRSINDLQAQLQELDTKGKRLDQENLESTNQRDKEIQEVSREITRLEQQIDNNSRIVSAHPGCVLEVTATAGQVIQPGTRLGNMQLQDQNASLMGISYFAVKDGKQIRPRMKLLITPDTVQRERFGGVVANITNVSALPVTTEGATSVIGNPEVVRTLMGEGGAAIEVNSNLEDDSSTVSGYKWSSSKGPLSKITPGTTATVRVTVEERAPITFVLPILRELSGMK